MVIFYESNRPRSNNLQFALIVKPQNLLMFKDAVKMQKRILFFVVQIIGT